LRVCRGGAQQNCSQVTKQLTVLRVFPSSGTGGNANYCRRGGRITEEYMRSTKFTLSMAALALGGLLSVPALAQMPDTHTDNAQNYKYPTGRSMNDGGYQAQQDNSGAAAPQYNLSPQYQQRRGQRAAARGQGQSPGAYRYVGENAGVSDTGYAGGWNQSWNQPWGEPQRQYYDYNPGWGGGFGVAPTPAAMDQSSACAARFRSFDPQTGTYIGLDGRRHICR
jgi:BA14K-like protein